MNNCSVQKCRGFTLRKRPCKKCVFLGEGFFCAYHSNFTKKKIKCTRLTCNGLTRNKLSCKKCVGPDNNLYCHLHNKNKSHKQQSESTHNFGSDSNPSFNPESKESQPESKNSQPESKDSQPESKKSQPESKESQPESKKSQESVSSMDTSSPTADAGEEEEEELVETSPIISSSQQSVANESLSPDIIDSLTVNLKAPVFENIFSNVLDLPPKSSLVQNDVTQEEMMEHLKEYWEHIMVPGDGSCFFHAFIRSVNLLYPEFRNINDETLKSALDESSFPSGGEYLRLYLLQNVDKMTGINEKELKSLKNRLKIKRAYAQDAEIQLASQLFGIHTAIFVGYGPYKNKWTLIPHTFGAVHFDAKERIVFLYNEADSQGKGLHFDMLIPRNYYSQPMPSTPDPQTRKVKISRPPASSSPPLPRSKSSVAQRKLLFDTGNDSPSPTSKNNVLQSSKKKSKKKNRTPGPIPGRPTKTIKSPIVTRSQSKRIKE